MISTKGQALAEARRRRWPYPALMEHPEGERYFVCAKLGSNIFGHGDTWDEAFADADTREESREKRHLANKS